MGSLYIDTIQTSEGSFETDHFDVEPQSFGGYIQNNILHIPEPGRNVDYTRWPNVPPIQGSDFFCVAKTAGNFGVIQGIWTTCPNTNKTNFEDVQTIWSYGNIDVQMAVNDSMKTAYIQIYNRQTSGVLNQQILQIARSSGGTTSYWLCFIKETINENDYILPYFIEANAFWFGHLGESTYNLQHYAAPDPVSSDIVGAGGGATHIAKITGLLSALSGNLSNVLIVAGGGGGGLVSEGTQTAGANGGGISGSGNNSADQNTGYAFGQGQAKGGGGGLYGGYKAANGDSGGAGSGYIGNALLEAKKMVGYNVPTSDVESTKTESVTVYSATAEPDKPKAGNGYAAIKWLRDLPPTTVFEFDFEGNQVQEFTASLAGNWLLEVWGASGGHGAFSDQYNKHSLGGYSQGIISLAKNDKLYVFVGGEGGTPQTGGVSIPGGINGGGSSGYGYVTNYSGGGGGGGATHIATENRGVLSNYNDHRDEILIVAGGGGGSAGSGWGAESYPAGANCGGGYKGKDGYTPSSVSVYPSGGTQDSGYQFGQGENGGNGQSGGGAGEGRGGGGGGWFGGKARGNTSGDNTNACGGGGSGYIDTTRLTEAYMAGYYVEASLADETKTNSITEFSENAESDKAKQGNGFARITFIPSN